VYTDWAEKYEHDIRSMGYDTPEQVAKYIVQELDLLSSLLQQQEQQHHCRNNNNHHQTTYHLRCLDAGCGNGLSGLALRTAIMASSSSSNNHNHHRSYSNLVFELVGCDVTPAMLDVAKTKRPEVYDALDVVNLNDETSIRQCYDTDSCFDLVTCVGALTYIDPNGPCLEEFVRMVRPNGYVVYTNRTDRLESFQEKVRRRRPR
jgi:SAM-dependent methyltransferase